LLDRIELEATLKVIKTLNYYQLLKVSPLASEEEIQEAFHREALLFHPDQYLAGSDSEGQKTAQEIYSRVVEAYRVLSNRNKRIDYDNKLKGIDKINEDEVEDENAITSVKHRPDWASSGPGDKFFKLAEKAASAGDYKSALLNVQIALGTEPSNPKYMKLKERVSMFVPKKK